MAEGIEVTRSLVDAHIHTGMIQYCITVSYKFESCPDYTIMNLGNDLDTRIHIVKRSSVIGNILVSNH